MNEWNTEHYGDACVVKVPVSLGRDANSFNINLWNGRWQTRWTQSVSLRTVTYSIKVEAHLEAIGSVFFKYWVAGEPDFQVPRVHYYSSISSLTVTCLIACVCVCVCVCELSQLSRVQLFATLWNVLGQAPQSMRFSRQEYWSGLPFPLPGDLPDGRMEPMSPALQADSLPMSHLGNPFNCLQSSYWKLLFLTIYKDL